MSLEDGLHKISIVGNSILSKPNETVPAFLYSAASTGRDVTAHSCGVYCRAGTAITLPSVRH